jgi:branched-chain amino acid aminotransferase
VIGLAWTRAEAGTPAPEYAWKNGEFVQWETATVHVSWINPIAGSGVYEGIRGYWNAEAKQLYLNSLRAHIRRLCSSMKILRLEIPFSEEDLAKAIPELVRRNSFRECIYIQPNVFRIAPPFGVLPPGTPSTWITIIAFPRPSGLGGPHTRKVGVSSWVRPTDQTSPPRLKSIANLLNGGLAETEMKQAGYEESIQLTLHGKVAEMGAGANICLVRDESVISPSNRQSILEGVTKDIVFRIAEHSLGLKTCAREVDRTELYVADEVFTCGTGHAEVTPVVSIDGIKVGDGNPGPITTKIRNLYHDLVMGKVPEYKDLVTPVY